MIVFVIFFLYVLLQCYVDLEMLNMSKYKSHLYMDTEDPGSGENKAEKSERKENHDSEQQQNHKGNLYEEQTREKELKDAEKQIEDTRL